MVWLKTPVEKMPGFGVHKDPRCPQDFQCGDSNCGRPFGSRVGSCCAKGISKPKSNLEETLIYVLRNGDVSIDLRLLAIRAKSQYPGVPSHLLSE